MPLSALFWLLSAVRRSLFKLGILPQYRSRLPVIVVGNIGIGGNGKTPVVLSIVEYLQQNGFTPAVLSRGYGGSQDVFPHLVKPEDAAQLVGDEPRLIASRRECIMVIDPLRTRGVRYLEQHTNADVIVCDDGLQHYALARDVELCVIDKRGLGNGFLLPAGPLREGEWRLRKVSSIVHNLGLLAHENMSELAKLKANAVNAFANSQREQLVHNAMYLQAATWVNVKSGESSGLQEFANIACAHNNSVALAGIGEPQRFFDSLQALGVSVSKCVGLGDHHAFAERDIPSDALVLMTEKDAVKCASFAHDDCWYLQIDACIDEALFDLLETTLNDFKQNRTS